MRTIAVFNKKEKHHYDDIIDLTHPQSTTRPHMSNHDRVAQFAPFAALTGYGTSIKETARLTEEKIDLDESEKEALNDKLQIIRDNTDAGAELTITYFVPDEKKTGGTHVSYIGCVKKIDEYARTLIMADKTIIPIEQISGIESELFRNLGT